MFMLTRASAELINRGVITAVDEYTLETGRYSMLLRNRQQPSKTRDTALIPAINGLVCPQDAHLPT